MRCVIAALCACAAPLAAGRAAPALTVSFDKVEGDRVAAQPAGVSGRVTGVRGPLWCQGVEGQAAYFTGDKDEAVLFEAPAAHAPAAAFGLRAWIYPAQFGDHQGVVWKGDRSKVPEQCQYKLTLRPEGKVEFGCKGPQGQWAQLISEQPLPLKKWTRVTVSFDAGASAMWFGATRVAQGALAHPKSGGGFETVRSLPPCAAPLVLGRMEMAGGGMAYPFTGALDGLELFIGPIEPEAVREPQGPSDPLASLLLFDKTFERAQLAATPWLTGTLKGNAPWLLEVSDPESGGASVWQQGRVEKGGLRFLLDDYTGALDLGDPARVRCRAFRRSLATPLAIEQARLAEGPKRVEVQVTPQQTFQRLRRQAAYANPPRAFLTNEGEQARVYGPVFAELREAGIAHLDVALGSLSAIEPRNDDADPKHLDLEFFRSQFKASSEAKSLVGFIRYARGLGYTFGIRSTSFAGWQVASGGGVQTHLVDEIAECWAALLILLKEEGLAPTHLVPVWEPHYAPATVARICAATQRAVRQQGFETPVIGPYVLTTGGQGFVMTAMPDRYDTGARYTKAYLEACPDAPIIALEDYASGTPLIRPNLARLWKEAIDPLSAGKPRELWMIEYGAPCGTGPWNFFPSRWHGALSTWESAFRLARAMNQLLDGGVSGFFFWKAWDAIGEDAQVTPSSWGLLKGPLHDYERRAAFHTGRIYWRNLPEGAVRVGASAGEGLAVNAVRHERSLNVFLINPRSIAMQADVVVAQTSLAPQARLVTATEDVSYLEQEVYGQGADRFSVSLPPHSVSALLCRLSGSSTRFTETRWPAPKPDVVYLTDLPWLSSSTSKGTMKPYSDGLQVDWRRDETIRGEWLVLSGVRYRRGLSHLGKGEIQFAIPSGAARFEARVGVDDGSVGAGPAGFTVKVDGRTAAEAPPLKKGEPPGEVSAALGEGRVLTLLIDTENPKVNAAFLEARFVLAPGR